MCECGCTMGNPIYRLPISKTACYAIELYPGCDYCSAAPGVVVRKVEKSSVYWDEVREAPLFPLVEVDGCREGAIKCGLEPDEFRKAAVAEMSGTEAEDGVIDADLAEILADDLWKSSLRRMPEVIAYQQAPDRPAPATA